MIATAPLRARRFVGPSLSALLLAAASAVAPAARAEPAPPAAPAAAPESPPTPAAPPPAPTEGVPSEAPPAPPVAALPPAAPAAQVNALSIKLDEADQIARIAARKVELLEEQLAARAKETPAVLADDKGFGLRSADGAYVIRFHGLLQADTRWFAGDDALTNSDTFLLRRFRPAIDGTLFNLADYRFVPDFAGSQAVVFDAYIDVHPTSALRLRAGKFKAPLGLERLQSDADLPVIERALTQYLTPNREVGAALGGELVGGLVGYSVGIYNGGVDNSNSDVDNDHAKDFIGRILIQPFRAEPLKAFGNLGLHLAVSRGDRRGLPGTGVSDANQQLPSFRTAGLNTFFTYLPPAADPSTTVFAHLTQSRINPGVYYYYGPLGLLSEAVWSKQAIQKGNTLASLTHRAVHATASVVLGGTNGYDGATPTHRFDPKTGDWGALELAVRWNWLKLDNATFPAYASILKSASEAQGWAGAVNFVPSRTLRFAVNYERTTFTGGAGTTATPKNRNTEAVIIGRVQVNF
jgi:phosphate-selective porin OprO/OprP